MSWKELPRWVKGGIFLGCIHVVIFYFFFFFFKYIKKIRMNNVKFVFILFFILDFFVTILLNLSILKYEYITRQFLIWGTLQWVVIGALIWSIEGKIKQRKTEASTPV